MHNLESTRRPILLSFNLATDYGLPILREKITGMSVRCALLGHQPPHSAALRFLQRVGDTHYEFDMAKSTLQNKKHVADPSSIVISATKEPTIKHRISPTQMQEMGDNAVGEVQFLGALCRFQSGAAVYPLPLSMSYLLTCPAPYALGESQPTTAGSRTPDR
ncbi:hypothetical protein H4582DRAFT_2051171 [Lactarius indigo]|nr:hypothetical protein H4582DRAFT_2051171 [Lactarius indigo]